MDQRETPMDEREQVMPDVPRADCGQPDYARLISENAFLRGQCDGYRHRLEHPKYSEPGCIADNNRLRQEALALRGELAEQLGRLAGTRLALRRAGQVIAWQCFGDCRIFSPEPVPDAAVVIAEIKRLLTMPADHIQEPDDGVPRT